MNRLDRLTAILTHLQSKKVVTASELAERFTISIRTVYRDIRALEEAGIPVGAEAGVGYFLDESFKLPPVSFTTQEATALLIAEKLVASFPDKQTQTAFADALFKIKAVLRPSQKDHLEALSESVHVLTHRNESPKEYQFLQDIQTALVQKQVVEIEYFAQYKNREERRCVEPIGLSYYMREWHLIAWCRLRMDYRDFRVDRIRRISLLGEVFKPEQRVSLTEYFHQWFRQMNLIEIVVQMPNNVLRSVDSSKYWFGYVSEKQIDDSSVEAVFYNHDLTVFAKWLLGLEPPIRIIKPDSLQRILQQLVDRLRDVY